MKYGGLVEGRGPQVRHAEPGEAAQDRRARRHLEAGKDADLASGPADPLSTCAHASRPGSTGGATSRSRRTRRRARRSPRSASGSSRRSSRRRGAASGGRRRRSDGDRRRRRSSRRRGRPGRLDGYRSGVRDEGMKPGDCGCGRDARKTGESLALAFFLSLVASAAPAQDLTSRASTAERPRSSILDATVHPVSGPPIENAATSSSRTAMITAVGKARLSETAAEWPVDRRQGQARLPRPHRRGDAARAHRDRVGARVARLRRDRRRHARGPRGRRDQSRLDAVPRHARERRPVAPACSPPAA